MPIRIFLSHASEDKLLIRSLHARLTNFGFAPWLDEIELIPGMNWKHEIQMAIKQCDVFLACLTPNSAKNGFLRSEFEFALEQYAMRREQAGQSSRFFLIPVKLAPCDLPQVDDTENNLNLNDFQWLEYSDDGGFEKLLRSINLQSKFTVFSDWIRENRFRLKQEISKLHITLELEKLGRKSWIAVCPNFGGIREYGRETAEVIHKIIQRVDGVKLGCIELDEERPTWTYFQVPSPVLFGEIDSYENVIHE